MKLFAETLAIIVNGELNSDVLGAWDHQTRQLLPAHLCEDGVLFEMASLAASMVATEDEEMRGSMRIFGYEVGMAFQIVDDILDFTGDQSAVGKPIGSDLINGLVTTGHLLSAGKSKGTGCHLLPAGGWKDTERVQRLVDNIRQSKAPQQAMDEARKAVNRALKSLSEAPVSPEARSPGKPGEIYRRSKNMILGGQSPTLRTLGEARIETLHFEILSS